MNILLTPIGSYGDVHPYVGIGMALQQRGHDVTLITNSHFEPLARQVGLRFVSSCPNEKYIDVAQDPDLWHPRRGFATAMTLVLSHIEDLYRIIQSHYVPGQTMLVGHSMAFASLVAREKMGIPMVGVHLSPAMLRSVYRPPVMTTGRSMHWLPKWIQRWIWREVDRYVIDPVICPTLNHWRWELGLEPIRRPFAQWIHSPDRVLGLWPDWFAPPQPDWPQQVCLTGFPLYDESGVASIPSHLRQFLSQGDAPIVFTPGSAMMHAQQFFEQAVEACLKMNRRGVFLTRFTEQLPKAMPSSICHADYAPLSQLLPRACAFVHHGGVGSCAQGLAAGVPQLIMPMSHDQPENASRILDLGVGDMLPPHKFFAGNLVDKLSRLIDIPEVWSRCKSLAIKCHQQDGRIEACDAIETHARTMRNRQNAAG